MKYKSYGIRNYTKLPQMAKLSDEEKFSVEVGGRVLPFKLNNYITEKLINWDDYPNDPVYKLTFPQRGMLSEKHFDTIADLLKRKAPEWEINEEVRRIRLELNPHPAGQIERNIPDLRGRRLKGIQHKYRETILFFPSQGQACHANCTFCFRWPQIVGMNNLKFAVREAKTAVEYLKAHPEVTDILITGGDPLIMPAKILEKYVDEFLNAYLPHIRTIRFGSRTLTYWPYRFLSDKDSEDLLGLFKKIKFAGKHVAFMASFVHPNELKTDEARLAIERILETGAQIRTQAPILRQVNDDWRTWEGLWRDQVNLGCVPYYMFVARDTGPRDYFALPLIESWRIFKQAYQSVSGICRTVRGPSMSADPGKLQILGSAVIRGENVLVMQFLQARNPEWVMRPFFAAFDEKAIWLDELKPAFGEDRFFYESEGSRHKGKNQYEYGDSKMRRTRVINAGVIHALNIGETMNRYDDLSYICLSD